MGCSLGEFEKDTVINPLKETLQRQNRLCKITGIFSPNEIFQCKSCKNLVIYDIAYYIAI